jgi:PTS system nitrogen regulatory IIA component
MGVLQMIYLRDYLDEDHIVFLEETKKDKAIERLIQTLRDAPKMLDLDGFRQGVFEREKIMSTGIGLGIAIPHVKSPCVKDIVLAIGISRKGISWDALDNQPVHLVFLIGCAGDQHQLYLRLLSKIILVLKNKKRREVLSQAKDAKEVIAHFSSL